MLRGKPLPTEVPEPEVPIAPIATTENPEACSKETLQRERLAKEIASDPKLREILFKRWLTEKAKRE